MMCVFAFRDQQDVGKTQKKKNLRTRDHTICVVFMQHYTNTGTQKKQHSTQSAAEFPCVSFYEAARCLTV